MRSIYRKYIIYCNYKSTLNKFQMNLNMSYSISTYWIKCNILKNDACLFSKWHSTLKRSMRLIEFFGHFIYWNAPSPSWFSRCIFYQFYSWAAFDWFLSIPMNRRFTLQCFSIQNMSIFFFGFFNAQNSKHVSITSVTKLCIFARKPVFERK
jgi:hypothetical protein